MFRKFLIATHSTPFPAWLPQWRKRALLLEPFGWHFDVFTESIVRNRVCQTFKIYTQFDWDKRKLCDFRPAYGEMFAREIEGYQFWGHVDLDCVYGRLDHFFPDHKLKDLDIVSEDTRAICGPFTIYRNEPHINSLFRLHKDWRQMFKSGELFGFDEQGMTQIVKTLAANEMIKWQASHVQANDAQPAHSEWPKIGSTVDGSLFDFARNEEIPLFHFNRRKQWPDGVE